MKLRPFCAFLQISLFFVMITSHDLYEGHRFGARMTYKEVKKHGLFFFKRKVTVDLDYPEGTNITGIACVDLDPEKRGTVIITEGGLYSSFIHLILESERGYGLRYIIEVYQ